MGPSKYAVTALSAVVLAGAVTATTLVTPRSAPVSVSAYSGVETSHNAHVAQAIAAGRGPIASMQLNLAASTTLSGGAANIARKVTEQKSAAAQTAAQQAAAQAAAQHAAAQAPAKQAVAVKTATQTGAAAQASASEAAAEAAQKAEAARKADAARKAEAARQAEADRAEREAARAEARADEQRAAARKAAAEEQAAAERKAAAKRAAADKAAADKAAAEKKASSGLDLRRASMWDRIAVCESTSTWDINTGNGFYGGLQFTIGTWKMYGGTEFASRADRASREEQITVANRIYDTQGGASPDWACARILGID